MIVDLATARCDFPDRPDWTWLHWHWQGQPLLREGANLQEIASREAGRLACLATPFDGAARAPDLAADVAASWLQDLARAEILAVSPAFQAGCLGKAAAAPAKVMPCCDFVIVPPAVGWREAQDVWSAVCLALRAVKPVYLLEGCA